MSPLDPTAATTSRATVLTAATRAVLLTRTGEGGGVDVIRTGTGSIVSTLALPFASLVARGTAAGTYFVLAAGPTDGVLVTVRLEDGVLREIGRVSTGGLEPCHLAVLDARTVAVANYTSGNVSVFDLDDDGLPSLVAVLPLTGSGPNPDRQEGPHPHFIWVDPADGGSESGIILDLGADRLRRLTRSASGSWGVDDLTALHPGAGPRHAVAVGGRLVVVDELSGEVTAVDLAAPREQYTVASTTLPGDSPVYPGDIVGVPGGIAVANRGRDSIAIVDVPAEGGLSLRRELGTGGEWPHQLGWDGKRIIVLELRSGRLLRLDPDSGDVEVVLDGLITPSWALDLDEEAPA